MSWYSEKSGEDFVAVSTRIRLARNLKSLPFASKMTDGDYKKLNEAVRTAVEKSELPLAKTLKFISMDTVPECERYSMVERHIISREFASNYKNRAILLSGDETVCVMLGEEDHIRIQVILSGLRLKKAYELANNVDDILISSLDIAYSEKLGFLTECMTNLGTGLRASVMLHLPALNTFGAVGNFSSSVSKLGFTVRGLYGEGSDASASLYQISNQVTLGISEQNAIDNLNAIAKQLITAETKQRKHFETTSVSDRVMRSLGILKYARVLSSEEAMRLISDYNLGLGLGIIEDSSVLPFKLFIETQPFMLMKTYGDMTPDDRDIKRAQVVRNSFGEK